LVIESAVDKFRIKVTQIQKHIAKVHLKAFKSKTQDCCKSFIHELVARSKNGTFIYQNNSDSSNQYYLHTEKNKSLVPETQILVPEKPFLTLDHLNSSGVTEEEIMESKCSE
jgi:hypothetical protein